MEDGWIYLHNPRRRLCWIPVIYRGPMTSWGNRLTLTSPLGLSILEFGDVVVPEL